MISIAWKILADQIFVSLNSSLTQGRRSLIVMPDIERDSMVDTTAAERLGERVANAPDQKRAEANGNSRHSCTPPSESGCYTALVESLADIATTH